MQKACSNSDIDLCLISIDSSQKQTILNFVKRTLQKSGNKRLLLDAKIYTKNEFNATIQGFQNPYWCTFFRDGVRLFGEEVVVPLLPHTFTNSVWRSIEQIQESLGYIEQKIFIDIACYQLWTAMSLVFTVDCLIHNKPFRKNSRTELAQKLLEYQYSLIKEQYERVSIFRRTQVHSGLSLDDEQSIKYDNPISDYSKIDTKILQKNGLRVLAYCEKVYQQIN
ncbi:hypothetical protein EU527_12750 [Candidatus Thorarchaeota archaeon]|nr:MAG: hypothetical protein EU527_12750 [Candidatus Thorarchaeota archaeon]